MNTTFGNDERERFVKTLKNMAAKPSMWLSAPTYWGFCSFIEGFDFAHNGEVLRAFSAWRKKSPLPTNLVWSAAFRESIFPLAKTELSPGAEKQAMQRLAELFESILLSNSSG